MKIIILAGGQGKRLWPISTQEFPKQFMHFGDSESLLKRTVKRFFKNELFEEVYIVTHEQYASHTLGEVQALDSGFSSRLLIEPYSKNTAPAIAWSIRKLLERDLIDPDEKIITLPIDHIFSDETVVLQQLLEAADAMRTEEIIAFGVECDYPATGYGYIKQGKELYSKSFQVELFVEKPTEHKAKELLREGNWLWNVGIYIFSAQTYWKELLKSHKVLYEIAIGNEYREEDYQKLQPISIDDAVVTDAGALRVRVLQNTEWSDVGSWNSLYKLLASNRNASIHLGNMGRSAVKRLIASEPISNTYLSKEPTVLETEQAFFISHGN
jgi:mannose-1-phosphate guanylyltransferase / mannose-6-phosphate isomerase